MKTVLEQGGIAPGGLNFDAKVRRESTALEDLFIAHILGMVSSIHFMVIHLFIYSFIYSFIHLFIYSFIHLFIYSFIYLFIYSFIHLFIYSFIYLFIYSFIHLFIYLFIHLFIYSFIYSFIHSFIHLFIYSFIYSFIHLFIYSLIHLFIHLFIYSSIHLFIYSFIYLFIYLLNYQDAFAKGLLGAAALLEDGILPGMVSARYASYREGFGKKLAEGKASLEECEAYVMGHGEPTQVSGSQEKYQSIFNTYT